MSKLFLFMCIIYTHSIISMETTWISLKKQMHYDFMRCYFAIKHPSVQIIGCVPQGQEHFVCHDYAFATALNFTEDNIAISRLHKFTDGGKDDILQKYFKKTSKPRPGDIINYTITPDGNNVVHSGIVYDENGLILSKWGEDPFLLLHERGDTLYKEARYVSYYTLNASPQELSQLKEEIKKEYQKSPQHRNSRSKLDIGLIRTCVLIVVLIGFSLYR